MGSGGSAGALARLDRVRGIKAVRQSGLNPDQFGFDGLGQIPVWPFNKVGDFAS